MPKIVINRPKRWADKLRKYKIIVDEELLGVIKENQTLEFPIDKGEHEMYCQIDWCTSNSIRFESDEENEVKTFRVESNLKGINYFFVRRLITQETDNYLSLKAT